MMRSESELRPYQQRIATHLYERNAALCIVRPGGGKTVTVLTAFAELQRDKVVRHALVIAPKRVARNVWPEEIAAWAHTQGLTYTLLVGSPARRAQQLKLAATCDLTIVGIDVVEWLMGEMEKMPNDYPLFDLLIIDEISKIRSPTGVRAKLLAKYAHRWKMIWGLSGTLRPNSALDLFMPVRVVSKGCTWGRSYYQWRKERFYPVDYHGYDWQPLPGAEDRINAEMAPLTATMHEDEAPQLPNMSVILDRVQLPPAARKMYWDMHTKLFAGFSQDQILAANSAVATGKLAQLANGFIYEDSGAARAVHDEKRAWLQDLIEESNAPLLLVYEFKEDFKMLREICGRDLPSLESVSSEHHIREWNAGNLPYLALHPASGGHGLNLQHGGADMAWIAPTWSPELWTQTIARLHRSGQSKPVMVRVCVADNTVDELKLDRVHHKMSAQAAFEAYLSRYQAALK